MSGTVISAFLLVAYLLALGASHSLLTSTVLSNASNPTPSYHSPGNHYFVRVTNQSFYDETYSCLVTERLDTALPHTTVTAADDFKVPISTQLCRTLILDIPIQNSMGKTAGNFRPPVKADFALYQGEDALRGRYNGSAAIANITFDSPTEGNWSNINETNVEGYTKDLGPGMYYHVDTYRFVWPNLSLRGNKTYWVSMTISVERAYNNTDFSQNQARWILMASANASTMDSNQTVSISTTNVHIPTPDRSLGSPYRVIDRYGTMFRQAPFLQNWTSADAGAENYTLSFIRYTPAPETSSKQLAFTAYVTDCLNVTRVPNDLILAFLPSRYGEPVNMNVSVESPSEEIPVPMTKTVPNAQSTSPQVANQPSAPVTSSPTSSSGTRPPTSNVVASPLTTPSTKTVVSSTPGITPENVASPWIVAEHSPSSSSSSSSSPVNSENITNDRNTPLTNLEMNMIIVVGIVGALLVALIAGVLLVAARHWIRTSYTNLRYEDLQSSATELRAVDPSQITLDDDDSGDSREETGAPQQFHSTESSESSDTVGKGDKTKLSSSPQISLPRHVPSDTERYTDQPTSNQAAVDFDRRVMAAVPLAEQPVSKPGNNYVYRPPAAKKNKGKKKGND
jgi:hypothetical protein